VRAAAGVLKGHVGHISVSAASDTPADETATSTLV